MALKPDKKNRIIVTQVTWEHIYLHLELEGRALEEFDYFVGNAAGSRYPVECSQGQLCLNIVNIPEAEVLPAGDWFLFARAKDSEASAAEQTLEVSHACGYTLEGLDKIYRYATGVMAYAVTFEIRDGEEMARLSKKSGSVLPCVDCQSEDLFLCIRTEYYKKKKSDGKHHPVAEACSGKEVLKGIVRVLLQKVLNGYYGLLHACTKRDGKHILFMSETRIMAGGNLQALDERMKERGLDQEYQISYAFSKTLEQGTGGRIVSWLKMIRLVAKQDFIFVDDYVPLFQTIDLRKDTELIQLWHAGVGFKSVGYARFGRRGSPHPRGTCHRRYDYVVVGASGLIPVYEEVFGIPKERILPLGLPRMDQYLNNEKRESFRDEFYQKYPELKNKKLILFAPTYRGNGQRDAYYPWDKIDFQAAYEMCGDTYIFALKMHPFVRDLPEISEKMRNRIMAFSAEDDINQLFYVTEILISDFSSNIYEFSVQNKPMIFYAFDKDYYQLTRGVHRRLEEFAPGKICETFEQVVQAIEQQDFETERREHFVKSSFDAKQGNASDRIIDQII